MAYPCYYPSLPRSMVEDCSKALDVLPMVRTLGRGGSKATRETTAFLAYPMDGDIMGLK